MIDVVPVGIDICHHIIDPDLLELLLVRTDAEGRLERQQTLLLALGASLGLLVLLDLRVDLGYQRVSDGGLSGGNGWPRVSLGIREVLLQDAVVEVLDPLVARLQVIGFQV